MSACISRVPVLRAASLRFIPSLLQRRSIETLNDKVIQNPLEVEDYFGVNKLVTLKELFDARVHLGHQEGCWEPKMKPFIYGTRAHHHIIDLNITLKNFQSRILPLDPYCHFYSASEDQDPLEDALWIMIGTEKKEAQLMGRCLYRTLEICTQRDMGMSHWFHELQQLALNVISHVVYKRGIILFVSAHPRFEFLIQKTAREAKEFFVTRQWYDGTLTNMHKMFPGCEPRQPDLMIFMNNSFLGRQQRGIMEAAMANIPTVGIVDTDCDPSRIMYPIPGNDDTPCAMELYCRLFKEAILNAKERLSEDMNDAAEEADEPEVASQSMK